MPSSWRTILMKFLETLCLFVAGKGERPQALVHVIGILASLLAREEEGRGNKKVGETWEEREGGQW